MVVISLISMLGYLFPVSYLLKLNFQRSLFLIISSIITLEYIFSFLDILKIGSYIILCLGYILLILSTKIFYTNHKYISKYFTPGFIIPFSITLFFSFLSLLIIPGTFDEWVQWLPHAKLLYFNEGFLTKLNSAVHPTYPVGASLFYYYSQFLSEFNVGSVYFAQCLLQMIPLLVLFEEKYWSNWNNVLIKFAALISILFIYNVRLGIGGSLYMDHPAAIFLGCALVFYLNSARNKKYILCLIPIFISVVQFKLGLSPFVYLVTLIIFIDQTFIFYMNNNIDIKIKRYIYYILPTLILLFFTYLSKFTWDKYILAEYGQLAWNWNPNIENVLILLINELTSTQLFDLNIYIQLLTEVRILFTANPIQFVFESTFIKYIFGTSPVLFFVHIMFLLLIYRYLKRKNYLEKEYVYINIIFVLGYVTYLFTLLLMFLNHNSGPLYYSFHRYLSIYQLIWIIYLCKLFFSIKFNYNKYFNYFSYIVILFLVIVPLLKLYRDNFTDYRFYRGSYLYESLKPMTSKVNKLTPDNSSVNIVWQSSYGSERGIIMSDLTPRHSINSIFTYGDPYHKGDVWTIKMSHIEFLKRLQRFDYLLLGYIDNNFWDNYGLLFREDEISDLQPFISYKMCKGEGWNSFGKSGCKHLDIKSYLFKIVKVNNNIYFENVVQ